MKKRVAILFSGFIRNWRDTCDNFLTNFIEFNKEQFNFDCYATTYGITDRYNQEKNNREIITDFEKEELKEKYKFKKIEFLSHKDLFIEHAHKRDLISKLSVYTGAKYMIDTIFLQTCCIKRAFDLLDGDHDFVIRVRFDSDFLEPTKIKKTKSGQIGTLSRFSNQGFLDHVVFGKKDEMRIFCKSYCYLYNDGFINNHSIKFVEDLFREVIKLNKIQIIKLPWKVAVKRRDSILNLYDENRL